MSGYNETKKGLVRIIPDFKSHEITEKVQTLQ